MIFKRLGFWLILFSLIIVGTWAFLFAFAEEGTGLWGFPNWLFGFFAIEVLFSLVIWAFTKYYWKGT